MVHPALHDGHPLTRQSAQHQPAGVAGGGGAGEVGDVAVGDGDGLLHHITEEPQAGAKDQGDIGGKVPHPGADEVGALLVMGEGMDHKISFPARDGQSK